MTRRGGTVASGRVARRALALLAAIAFVGTLAVGCTNEPDPIRVGAVYPLDGSQGPGGVQEYRGVRLAASFANDDGGVGGRPLQLQPVDVPSSDAAESAVAQLHASGIRFVVGSYGSTISAPAADAAAARGMLFWETGAVGEMTGRSAGDLVFRMPPTGVVLGRAAIEFMAEKYAAQLHENPHDLRFAVANVNDVYGTTVARGAVQALHARGLHLVGRFPYDANTVDMPALVDRIAAAKPDVLFVSAYMEDGVALRRQIVRAGVQLTASIGTSSSYCMPMFGQELGRDAVGLFASDKPDAGALNPQSLLPGARTLLQRASSAYRDRYGEQMSAPALAGFSAGWALFHDVMPRASGMTPEAVSSAARATRIPQGGLPNGSGLQMAPPGSPDAGANLLAASVIWEWISADRRAVVWPPEYATQPPRAIPIQPLT
jgi:branched-chain amino acid transport system substrate-binding protein